MHNSVDTLRKKINDLNKLIKECTNPTKKVEMLAQQKRFLDSLHTKKFKSRISDTYRRGKKAQDKIPKKPEQPIKIVYKDKIVEIIKEVPVEVPVEVEVIKEVYINTGDGIPQTLEVDEFTALLKDVRDTFIRTHTDLKIGDTVETTSDGKGKIKALDIDEDVLYTKAGGIFAKLKKIRLSDGKEGQRYLGKDPRGYNVNDLIKTTTKRKSKTKAK